MSPQLKTIIDGIVKELQRLRSLMPYRVTGNTVEFDKIVVAKNRLVVPQKDLDAAGLEGEIIINGVHAYVRVNNTWKQIT